MSYKDLVFDQDIKQLLPDKFEYSLSVCWIMYEYFRGKLHVNHFLKLKVTCKHILPCHP